MKTPEEICELYRQRKDERGPDISRMEEIQRHYETDYVIPMPEIDNVEKPAAVNLLAQGVDQLADKAASTQPDCMFPLVGNGDPAVKQARDQRKAVLGWWDMNDMGMVLRRRFRYLIAYGYGPMTLSPFGESPLDRRTIPHWRNRNPLTTFWAHTKGEDIEPLDVVCSGEVTLGWLRAMYPEQAGALYKGRGAKDSDRFTVLEYQDSDEIVLVVEGKSRSDYDAVRISDETGFAPSQLLEWTYNRAKMPLVVVPSRITLGKTMGHFDGTLGMFMRRSRLQAWEDIAIFKSILQEGWLVSHPNAAQPNIIRKAEPKKGIYGIIENGTIQIVTPQPGAQVPTAIDRMERNERVQGMMPAEMGGESASNIRTARRGQEIMSSAIDPTIQELQEIASRSMRLENERAIAIAKAWYGEKQFSFYIPRNGVTVRNDYTPNKLFETDWNVVKYSMPGVAGPDIATELGMRVGTGEISLQTSREVDPLVEDPVLERDRVLQEALDKALLTGIEQQLAQGTMDPRLAARIIKQLNQTHDDFATVMLAVDDQMKQEQAQQQQSEPQPEDQQPGMGAGMQGGQMQGQPPAAIGPAAPSLQNLQGILGSLHGAQQASPPQGQLQAAS